MNRFQMLVLNLTRVIFITIMATFFLFSAGPTIAQSSDASTYVSIETIPTFKSISVYYTYSGDSNLDNQAVMNYRKLGASEWVIGHKMDRSDPFYRVSVVGLTPNTAYEVRVTLEDPDGVTGTKEIIVPVNTRNEVIPFGTGVSYYVSTLIGSDANAGSEGQPFRTIQKALNTVQAGDTVYIMEGTYREGLLLNTPGTSSNYITITNYNNEQVIIDGNAGSIVTLLEIRDADYVIIKGLTIQNALNSLIVIYHSDHVLVEDNTLIEPAYGLPGGLYAAVDLRSLSKYAVIRNNFFDRRALVPGQFDERGMTDLRGVGWWKMGHGTIIYNNVFTGGYGDAIGGGPENNESKTNDMDIYDNFIDGACFDDAIQIEGSNKNTRVWNNVMRDCFIAIALAPSFKGPLYIFRNIIYDNDFPIRQQGSPAMLKLGSKTYSPVYIYHNTYYANSGADGFEQTNAELDYMVSKNNIIRTGKYLFEFTSKVAHMEFDYDALYTTSGKSYLKWFSTTYGSFNALNAYLESQGRTKQELNAIFIDPLPEWVDPANHDFRLKSGSPLIDRAVILPGFNNRGSAWAYVGLGPDIGAFEEEYGASIVIDGGATYATSPSVTLDLNCQAAVGVKEFRFSNDGGPYGAWEGPSSSKAWTLPSVEGIHTVSYECKDNNLGITSADDDIILESTPPSEPNGLSLNVIGEWQINLNWSAASDPESGISGYNIYREDSSEPSKLVGSTFATSFNDTGLSEATAYTYWVSAVNGVNVETKSQPVFGTTLDDTTPPVVSDILTAGPTSLRVSFSEPVDAASAINVANYSIDNGISVISATLAADSVNVTLTISTLVEGVNYVLDVKNVRDLAATPNTIVPALVPFISRFDLVSYWKFDLGTGTTALDSAGTNDGVLLGGMTQSDWIAGVSNTALDFDGSDDLVYVANPTDLSFAGSDNFTFQLWVMTSVCQSSGTKFIEKKQSGSEEILIECSSSGKVATFTVRDSNANSVSVAGTTTITDNQWHQVVGVKEGDLVSIYVDGALEGSQTKQFTGNWNDGDLRIGASIDGGSRNTQGGIDEVRIYTRALTDSEIALSYQNLLAPVVVCPTLQGFAQSRDLSNAGVCDDINGNGRLDFSDVVTFFENLNSAAVQDDWEAFDFNSNGSVDMADVISLFGMLVQ